MTKEENLALWQNNRFGMFIHWGLYSIPARGEWVMSIEQISPTEYEKYFTQFNPDLYEPKAWAKYVKKAGMKYVVLTTKHHEGFCMWDSAYTDYKITNTPYGKDILREFVDAFREEGIRIGLYYSLLDWHHPDYTIHEKDFTYPMRNDEEFKANAKNRDMKIYAEYMRNQITEILSNYGEIDLIWFDFSIRTHDTGEIVKGKEDWESEKIIEIVRRLQPHALINNRLDVEEYGYGWDFTTPEQILLRESPKYKGKEVPWEACHTFSGGWGYDRDNLNWKDSKQVLTLLVDSVSKGGNLLMNVGPTARGEFEERAKERLDAVGEWMRVNSDSIYGCTKASSSIAVPDDCRLTYSKETGKLYVHIFNYPPTGELYLDGISANGAKYAKFLHDGSELRMKAREAWQANAWTEGEGILSIKLPTKYPDIIVPVVEIALK